MAIDKINTYANDDTNILAVQTTADQLIINRTSVSLTNMTDTTLPVVAAGSYFDCGGTLYKVGTNTTPSGTPTDNATCYIMATPAVDGLTATLSFTNTAPTWNDSKQGWYGTAGNAGNVYLPIRFYRAGTVYYDKHHFRNVSTVNIERLYPGIISYKYTGGGEAGPTSKTEFVSWTTKVLDNGNYFQTANFMSGCGGMCSFSALGLFNNYYNHVEFSEMEIVSPASAVTLTYAFQFTNPSVTSRGIHQQTFYMPPGYKFKFYSWCNTAGNMNGDFYLNVVMS